MSEANEDLLRMVIPEAWRKAMNSVTIGGVKQVVEILKPGATFADAIAYGLAKNALQGDASCAKEMRESTEGKATQRVELVSPEDRGFEVSVTFEVRPGMTEREARAKAMPAVAEKVLDATVVAAVTQATEKDE